MYAEEAVLLVELYHTVMICYDTAYALYAVAVSVAVLLFGGMELRVILKHRDGDSVSAEDVLIITGYRKFKDYTRINRALGSLDGVIEDVAEKGCHIKVVYTLKLSQLARDNKGNILCIL